MKSGNALDMMLVQIELRDGFLFEVEEAGETLLCAEEQVDAWRKEFSAF